LRAHGWVRGVGDTSEWADALADFDGDPRYSFVTWGTNLRPTETAAAVLQCQLARWSEIHAARDRVARRLLDAVEVAPGCRTPRPHAQAAPSWFGIPILCESRDARTALVDRLEAQGVETRAIIAGNLARQPVCVTNADARVTWGDLPGADRLSETGLYVGILPDASEALRTAYRYNWQQLRYKGTDPARAYFNDAVILARALLALDAAIDEAMKGKGK